MRILHTSDWHIGKKLNKSLRLDEQKEVLDEICGICEKRKVQLVIIAGDVFDTFVPMSAAEDLFFETLSKLATPERAVVAISGNHDDWQRLSATRSIASKSNVYIFGGQNPPACGPDDFNVKAIETGTDYLVVSDGNEKLYIGVLPYPGEAKIGELKSNMTFDGKMKEWIDGCFVNNREDLPQIFISHIFMLGGKGSESEREIELGGARVVSPKYIPDNCLYTALGHLHKRQVISNSRNIIYSGAPLQYGFDEIGIKKSVTYFEINGKNVEKLEIISIKSGKKLVKISAVSLDAAEKLLELYKDCKVQLTLNLNSPLSDSETKELAGNFPCLTELQLNIRKEHDFSAEISRKNMDAKRLFTEYYKNRCGEEVPEDILKTYLGFIEEIGL